MKDTDFLNVSAYVRVQEKNLLDSASMDRIADAVGTKEALRMISQNSDYDFSSLRRPEDYEDIIKQERKRVFEMAYKLAKNFPAVVDIVGCKYDYHNCKVALKAVLQGQAGSKLPYVEATPIDPALIEKQAIKADPKSNLPTHLQEALRIGREAFEQEQNPQMIDIALDAHMYGYMRQLCDTLDNRFITGYVKNAIDYYNLKTLVRVKNMQKGTAFLASCLVQGGHTDPGFFVSNYGKTTGALALAFTTKDYGRALKAGMESYEKTGNYSDLERLLDNLLVRYIQDAKRISFGPEILFTYLLSKENEIRQIRIVIACKNNQIPADILKERLRDNYV